MEILTEAGGAAGAAYSSGSVASAAARSHQLRKAEKMK